MVIQILQAPMDSLACFEISHAYRNCQLCNGIVGLCSTHNGQARSNPLLDLASLFLSCCRLYEGAYHHDNRDRRCIVHRQPTKIMLPLNVVISRREGPSIIAIVLHTPYRLCCDDLSLTTRFEDSAPGPHSMQCVEARKHQKSPRCK